MVEIFCKQSEIMPSDETIEQHRQKRAEEIADMDKDKASPEGLFKGTFPPRRAELLYDEQDGVFRCPRCQYEHEGGPICTQCGTFIDGSPDYSDDGFFAGDLNDLEDLDELELDLDEEDENFRHHHMIGFPHFGGYPHFRHPQHNHLHHLHHHHGGPDSEGPSESSDMEENSEDDEEDSGSLQDFVVDDEDDGHHRAPANNSNNQQTAQQTITIIDDDSDEGGAVSNRRRRRGGPIVISSSPVGDAGSVNSSEHDEIPSEADMLRSESGWSSLDTEDERELDDTGLSRYHHYESASEDQQTDDESDSNTMRNGPSDEEDDDHEPRSDMQRIARHIYDVSPVSYETENEEDDDELEECYDGGSEVAFAHNTDRDGDTEMSVSPRTSRSSRSVSVEQYDYDRAPGGSPWSEDVYRYDTDDGQGTPRALRGSSVSQVTTRSQPREPSVESGPDEYDDMGENPGNTHQLHDVEGDSSDASVTPLSRPRRRRNRIPNQLIQQTDPRISMIFAEHQQSLRAVQMGQDNMNSVAQGAETGSRQPRMNPYLVPMPPNPLRNSRSPGVASGSGPRFHISSSTRGTRGPRQYQRHERHL
jgi:hypothetical protein